MTRNAGTAGAANIETDATAGNEMGLPKESCFTYLISTDRALDLYNFPLYVESALTDDD